MAPAVCGHQERGSRRRSHILVEEWFVAGACDGFNLMCPAYPDSLDDFVDLVVPELQRRGLFRTTYPGTTWRDSLGMWSFA